MRAAPAVTIAAAAWLHAGAAFAQQPAPPAEPEPLAPPAAGSAPDPTAPPPSPPGRWLSVGGNAEVHIKGGGLRGELDALRRGGWTLGIAAGLMGTEVLFRSGLGELSPSWAVDVRALAVVAGAFQSGPWRLRGHGGFGAAYFRARGFLDGDVMTVTGIFLVAEVCMTLGRELGQRWAIDAGPMLLWYGDKNLWWKGIGVSRDLTVHAFIGVRRQL